SVVCAGTDLVNCLSSRQGVRMNAQRIGWFEMRGEFDDARFVWRSIKIADQTGLTGHRQIARVEAIRDGLFGALKARSGDAKPVIAAVARIEFGKRDRIPGRRAEEDQRVVIKRAIDAFG